MNPRCLFRRLRWGAIALLALLLTVQWSSYSALTAWPQSVAVPRYGQTPGWASRAYLTPRDGFDLDATHLLAQLHNLPNGTISLPDFDPAVNTFQFSNQELIEAIDLQRNAADWEEVMTEQLQQLFGTQVCIGQEVRACVLTSAAQDWLKTQLGRMSQGISDGMAAAVLSLWQPPPPRIPWWQRLINFLLGRTVFGLVRTLFDLQTYIANLFLMQSVPEVFQQTQAIRDSRTPTQILLSILNIFLTGSRDPFTMGVYRILEGVLTEGHSLTPYRIEERGEGQYWVYVYDSNYPVGRANSPTDLHMEFDTLANTWTYQPNASAPAFTGDAQSKTLDLTQLSWRQPETPATLELTGPFTCPFCAEESPSVAPTIPESAPPTVVDITLTGEGQMTVLPYSVEPATLAAAPATEQVALVPFKGGLNREVPASYHLPAESLDRPFQIRLTGIPTSRSEPSTLQLAGPGYTANFEGLSMSASETLTLYVVPNRTGPELTFVTNRATEIPKLSIHLSDSTNTYTFDSSTPEEFSLTERQVSRSSGFELGGLKLPAGKRVALSAKGDLKRLYFADDDLANSQYGLTVRNRMVIRDRIQLGQTNPDFLNYTLTYEEDLRARNIQVDGQTQAFFDYDPAFVDPSNKPRQELLAAFEQRDFPITIAYEPLTASAGEAGPLRMVPSGAEPIDKRVFQGSLRKAGKGG
jgi:xanthosine utilization system XapX-like protein